MLPRRVIHQSGGWLKGFGSSNCNSCGTCVSAQEIGAPIKAAFNPETTDPVSRYAGVGNTTEFAVFYSGLPALSLSTVPAGGVAK